MFTDYSIGIIHDSVSFTFFVIFRSVNSPWRFADLNALLQVVFNFDRCTIYKQLFSVGKIVMLQFFWLKNIGCIYHCFNSSESATFVPIEFECNTIYLICSTYRILNLTFLSWFVSWHIFSLEYFVLISWAKLYILCGIQLYFPSEWTDASNQVGRCGND